MKRVPHPEQKESRIIQLSALLLGGSGGELCLQVVSSIPVLLSPGQDPQAAPPRTAQPPCSPASPASTVCPAEGSTASRLTLQLPH